MVSHQFLLENRLSLCLPIQSREHRRFVSLPQALRTCGRFTVFSYAVALSFEGLIMPFGAMSCAPCAVQYVLLVAR
jgi:hypothetical protein